MTPTGLTTLEASRRLVEHGANELPLEQSMGLVARIGNQLRDPMIMLLCGALVLVVAVGDRADAIIIGAVIVLNTAIGVVQDVRAQHAVDALSRMAAPRAHVWRDGVLMEVAAGDVVPGDSVRLEAGDIVPADLLLVEASSLEVDESTMTGESMPVRRDIAEEVVSGTVVTRGRGIGRVVRTGGDSGLGRIAALVAGAGLRPTPLQRRLARLSQQLVLVVSVICAVVFLLAIGQGMSWSRRVGARGQPRGGGRARVAPGCGDDLPGPRGPADGASLGGRAAAAGGRDAGLGHRPRLRQDRHPDPGGADREEPVDAGRHVSGQRDGLRRRRPRRRVAGGSGRGHGSAPQRGAVQRRAPDPGRDGGMGCGRRSLRRGAARGGGEGRSRPGRPQALASGRGVPVRQRGRLLAHGAPDARGR